MHDESHFVKFIIAQVVSITSKNTITSLVYLLIIRYFILKYNLNIIS